MVNEGAWQIVVLDNSEDGKLVYRIMTEMPADVDCSDFTENVSVYWVFADGGLPNEETGEALRAFEELLGSLDNPEGNSLLTLVFSGRGKREWSYYAKDYNKFMAQLNDALAAKPRFPLGIEHSHDPDWEYWNGIKEHVCGVDP